VVTLNVINNITANRTYWKNSFPNSERFLLGRAVL
jgi:hypothetical protein